MTVKNNQYGYPCHTYFYIVNDLGLIYHKDSKWRSKCLKELWSHGFRTEFEANKKLIELQLNK